MAIYYENSLWLGLFRDDFREEDLKVEEKQNPNDCKYCGCDKFNADSVSMTRFRCGSSYWHNEEMWQVANGCAAKCAVQLVEMRERVQRAVEVLEAVTRFDVIPWDGGVCRDPSDGGGEVDADIVDQVIEILEGETDGKAD